MRPTLLLAAACLLLSSCAATYELPAATAGPLDSTLRSAGLSTGKMKFKGPVIFQVGGTGNVATTTSTDNRKAGQRQGSAATAPGATASTTTRQAGTAWYWFVLVGAAFIAAWEALKRAGKRWLPI